jgi:glycosyltransferase involved in cell wall biosynthesis
MRPLISVIIPVYNVSNYLKQCLDSIINQTYKNLEIIFVSDCSTDFSLKIYEVYEQFVSINCMCNFVYHLNVILV